MNQTRKQLFSMISVVLSFLMVLSVISFPTLNANADGSAGTLDDFVERCYTVTLDRPSDPDGFADWKGQLLNGKAVGIEVAYGFLFSPEYTRKNKDNDAYLKDLYMLFMGREPDEGGYNDWMSKLNSGVSRLEVFAGFANSTEFYNICDSYGITAGRYVMGYDRKTINNVNLYVERMYKICLGRIGDKDGQKNWVEKLIKKEISGSECARSFIFSKEYTNLGLSDAEFVENLYLAMFGRPSDADGKNNWLYGLKNGMTRDEVFAGFANSVEFDNICKAYGIDRGTYTATNKGTFDKDNPNNVPVTPEEPTPTHTHKYNKKNTDSKYLKSAATCTEAAVYYYSCECGEKDTSKTFTSGSALGHNWDKGTITKKATYAEKGVKTYKCKGCDETKSEDIPCLLIKTKVGDTITFGKYDLNGDGQKKDIEWIVLSKEYGRALVISKDALDCKPYNNSSSDITWENSSLRSWLNNEFLNEAFNENEINHIYKVTNENKDNPKYNTPGGSNTKDQVFCLSLEEVEKYFGYSWHDDAIQFGYNRNLMCRPTQYAKNHGALEITITSEAYNEMLKNFGFSEDIIGNSAGCWWLRTPGKDSDHVCFVNQGGGVGADKDMSLSVDESFIAVRPAMYIEYETHNHKYNKKSTESKFFKSEATYTDAAVYYYSCECGEYDESKTFKSGKSLLNSKNVGDIIPFGTYEQDGDSSRKEEINWIVLSKENGRALLLSEEALDVLPYNTTNTDVTWKDSSLRKWLNEDFYSNAFADNEKNHIPKVTIQNNDSVYDTSGGGNTEDYVFCLSLEELVTYFGDYMYYNSETHTGYNEKLICFNTQDAYNRYPSSRYTTLTQTVYDNYYKGYGYSTQFIGKATCNWWLRSIGGTSKRACYVSSQGGVVAYGDDITLNGFMSVRPAIYVNYDK